MVRFTQLTALVSATLLVASFHLPAHPSPTYEVNVMSTRVYPYVAAGTPTRGRLVAFARSYALTPGGVPVIPDSPVVLDPTLNAGSFDGAGLGVIDRVLGRSQTGQQLVQVITTGEAAVLNAAPGSFEPAQIVAYSLQLRGLARFDEAPAGLYLGSYLGDIVGSSELLSGILLDPAIGQIAFTAYEFPDDSSLGDPVIGRLVATRAGSGAVVSGPAIAPEADFPLGMIGPVVMVGASPFATLVIFDLGSAFCPEPAPGQTYGSWRRSQSIGSNADGLAYVDPAACPSTILRPIGFRSGFGVPVWAPVTLPTPPE